MGEFLYTLSKRHEGMDLRPGLECDSLNTHSGRVAAKINLAVDVLKKRTDGYMTFQ